MFYSVDQVEQVHYHCQKKSQLSSASNWKLAPFFGRVLYTQVPDPGTSAPIHCALGIIWFLCVLLQSDIIL